LLHNRNCGYEFISFFIVQFFKQNFVVATLRWVKNRAVFKKKKLFRMLQQFEDKVLGCSRAVSLEVVVG
jgi:flagellar biosynthesis regulator FlbT